jgi:Ca2+-binding EF-hand superfamily protein
MTRSHHLKVALAICVALPLCTAGTAHAQSQGGRPESANSALKAIDPDNDGTVSLDEAKAAADRKFDALNKDHDTTLEPKEARPALSDSAFRMANPDGDGTLDKAEWQALVERRFKAADVDHDGTLTAKELASPAGKSLLGLLR